MPTITRQHDAKPVPTRVVVIDDHPVVRRGLAALIEDDPLLQVVGTASRCLEALDVIARLGPDVVIVDISLGPDNGLDIIGAVRTPVIVVSDHDEAVFAERALRAGARGYVAKTQAPTDIVAAIHRVLEGRLWVSDGTAERILTSLATPLSGGSGVHPADVLTERERHVLSLVARGLPTREIASALGVAFKTVEAHYAHIKDKTGVRSGRELIRMAVLWRETGRLP